MTGEKIIIFHKASRLWPYYFIEENVGRGNLESLSGLTTQGKALGAEFYACINSMSILNIARDELIGEVNRPMGLTTFLSETAEYQLLFI